MADTKISALTDGAPAQSTDIIPVARAGANCRVTVGDVVALGVAGQASSVDSEIALFSGTGGKTIKRASTTGILKASSGVIGAAVSGTDVKTVGGASLLGSGDVTATMVRVSSGIPFILTGGTAASNQLTMGANGALTNIITQPETWPAAYIYLPAGKAYSGSAAGWYFAVFSSTTAATVYNNIYTSGNPTIPGSPTAISDPGPGAFSQTTATYITGLSKTLPGGSMGPNGRLRIAINTRWSSSTTGKYNYVRLGGVSLGATSTTSAGVTGHRFYMDIWNDGSESRNVGTWTTALGGTAISYQRNTVNTATDKDITVQSRIEAGTEYNIVEHFCVESCYGA